MNLPNKLTMIRMAMIPFFVACFYLPFNFGLYIAAGVFAFAYATDALDGYLARKNKQVTDFGKLMDPIADKLLSAAALIMLCYMEMIHPVAVIIILSREFFISGLRLVCADKGIVVAASNWGKLKTISQAVCIMAVMLFYPLDITALRITADVLVWISVALALISGIDYTIKNRSCLNSK